jgi:hypothetical protein
LVAHYRPSRFSEIASKFATESTIIGRIVIGYAELEIAMLHCVHTPLGDLDSVLKTMFKARGELLRIKTASRLGRPIYESLKLGSQFQRAIDDMNHCRIIRNQYAHCIWHGSTDRLGFVNLEEIAISNVTVKNLLSLDIHFTDATLLTEQGNCSPLITVERG